MADVGDILTKVRALGAEITLEHGVMTISGTVRLNADQRKWLVLHRQAIEAHLRKQRPSSTDNTLPRPWADFARELYQACPETVDPYDWSWFVTTAGKIVREEFGEAAA